MAHFLSTLKKIKIKPLPGASTVSYFIIVLHSLGSFSLRDKLTRQTIEEGEFAYLNVFFTPDLLHTPAGMSISRHENWFHVVFLLFSENTHFHGWSFQVQFTVLADRSLHVLRKDSEVSISFVCVLFILLWVILLSCKQSWNISLCMSVCVLVVVPFPLTLSR